MKLAKTLVAAAALSTLASASFAQGETVGGLTITGGIAGAVAGGVIISSFTGPSATTN